MGISRSLRLGQLLGIDIYVHPSFALILLWAVWQWGFGANGGVIPLLLGFNLVVLIFLSVLLHELGHSAMAKQLGQQVRDVTLWPFGGVAQIEQVQGRPRHEMLIALAGPAMNLAIVVALLPLIALSAVVVSWDQLIPGPDFWSQITPLSLLVYVAVINALLFLFNLLPAFPLDGGRILRAALTSSVGRVQATSVAVVFGWVLTVALVVYGIVTWNVIPPIMGVILFFAARVEAKNVRIESAMQRLTVGQYALWDMGGISADKTLSFALRGGPRDLVVTDRGRVVGMLWRTQLLDGLQSGLSGRTVGELMDRDITIADPDDSIYDVHYHMTQTNRWAIPVVENGVYRGIFTAERFVHLHRQISPGIFGQRREISEEWKEAISASLRIFRQRS